MNAKEIVKEISRFFGEKSRSAAQTLAGLRDIQEEVESCIDALKSDGVDEG